MTAPLLSSDRDLLWALAGPEGVPNDREHPDPRLEALAVDGRIWLYGDRWRWRVRIPSQLPREQREFIADEAAWKRREDR